MDAKSTHDNIEDKEKHTSAINETQPASVPNDKTHSSRNVRTRSFISKSRKTGAKLASEPLNDSSLQASTTATLDSFLFQDPMEDNDAIIYTQYQKDLLPIEVIEKNQNGDDVRDILMKCLSSGYPVDLLRLGISRSDNLKNAIPLILSINKGFEPTISDLKSGPFRTILQSLFPNCSPLEITFSLCAWFSESHPQLELNSAKYVVPKTRKKRNMPDLISPHISSLSQPNRSNKSIKNTTPNETRSDPTPTIPFQFEGLPDRNMLPHAALAFPLPPAKSPISSEQMQVSTYETRFPQTVRRSPRVSVKKFHNLPLDDDILDSVSDEDPSAPTSASSSKVNLSSLYGHKAEGPDYNNGDFELWESSRPKKKTKRISMERMGLVPFMANSSKERLTLTDDDYSANPDEYFAGVYLQSDPFAPNTPKIASSNQLQVQLPSAPENKVPGMVLEQPTSASVVAVSVAPEITSAAASNENPPAGSIEPLTKSTYDVKKRLHTHSAQFENMLGFQIFQKLCDIRQAAHR